MTITEDRNTIATIDPRGAARLPLTLHGEILTADGPLTCTVEDISTTGAKVRAAAELEPGEAGILRCDELDILAEVRWRSGTTHGLTFAEPTDPSVGEPDEEFEEINRRANNRRFFRLLQSQY